MKYLKFIGLSATTFLTAFMVGAYVSEKIKHGTDIPTWKIAAMALMWIFCFSSSLDEWTKVKKLN